MRIMTRMGTPRSTCSATSNDFNRGLHSTLDCNPERRFICHFPQDNTIWSIGSGYGGNVLLGKKCLALRIGSYLGKKEGWLAEHMLILGVESPEGEMTYVAAAFPSACGKTNFAMMIPPKRFKGWKIWTVGDDIAWMRVGDGRPALRDQPRGRLLRRRAGHELRVEPERDEDDRASDTIFTNVARDARTATCGGKARTAPVPAELTDWQGQPVDEGLDREGRAPELALHRAGDATTRRSRKFADDPEGVPISAIIFGGRRATTVPLVMQAFNWTHGVFFGATLGSETTAAADRQGRRRAPRPDGDAALLRLQHGRATSRTGSSMQATHHVPAEDLPRELVPQGQGRQVPLAGLRREHARAQVDRRSRAPARRRPGDARSAGCRRRATSISPASTSRTRQVDEATHIDLDEWKTELESQRRVLRQDRPDDAARRSSSSASCSLARIESMHGRWKSSRTHAH